MLNYYICDNCRFSFERHGSCTQCPDCGKERVRETAEEEKETYLKIKSERELF